MNATTAADIIPGAWVRFPNWEQWRYVLATLYVPFSPSEPRTTGYVSYDAADRPGGRFTFGGFAVHDEPCHVVRVTPEAVTS